MTTTVLTKEDIDWGNLGFDYKPTTYRFAATYKDGAWSEGELITSQTVQVHEGSTSLHYGQQCFEGMKAQTAKDGRVLLFRPELNAERMRQSCDRLSMAEVPEELFSPRGKRSGSGQLQLHPSVWLRSGALHSSDALGYR